MASAGMDTRNNLCGKPAMASRSFFTIAVVYTAAILGGLAWLWFPSSTKIDWPAWVQALGSVGAILVAIGISQWEAGRARRDRIETRREFRKAVAGLARRLADLIAREAQSLINNKAFHTYEGSDGSQFTLLDAALDRFDPSALVSSEGVLALEELRRTAKSAGWWEKVVAEDYEGIEHYEFNIDEAIQRWSDGAEECARVLETLAAERS